MGGCGGEATLREEELVLGAELEKEQCEVFGCGRRALGSYSIAPGTMIRLCPECAERERVLTGALMEPSDVDGNGKIRAQEQTQY